MNYLIKFIPLFILTFTLISCQGNNDTSRNKPVPDNPQQSLQAPMQQPTPDIELSDDELTTFTNAVVGAQKVQMQTQQQMVTIIEEEGIDVETFSKIAKARQKGQPTDKMDVSDQDLKNFKTASKRIGQVQSELQKEVATAVEEAGMNMQRFQEINRAARQDSALRARIVQEIQDSQMQQPRQN